MWTVDRIRGEAGDVHARRPPTGLGPTVWVVETTGSALVLGSTQTFDDVDPDACRRADVEVVRRRSGGGAVLLVPGEVLWVDVILPAGHAAWDDDVVRSAWWLGEIWSEALRDVGVNGSRVHRGGLVSTTWSRVVCFTGVGPGEVLIGDSKLVGISQRRTRDHARFQCALHHQWRPDLMRELLQVDGPGFDHALATAAATCDVDDHDLVDALVARLDEL